MINSNCMRSYTEDYDLIDFFESTENLPNEIIDFYRCHMRLMINMLSVPVAVRMAQKSQENLESLIGLI